MCKSAAQTFHQEQERSDIISHLRSGAWPVAVSTARGYETAQRLFCEYVADLRYEQAEVYERRFGRRLKRPMFGGLRGHPPVASPAALEHPREDCASCDVSWGLVMIHFAGKEDWGVLVTACGDHRRQARLILSADHDPGWRQAAGRVRDETRDQAIDKAVAEIRERIEHDIRQGAEPFSELVQSSS